jgi:hypothetical protein
MLYEDLILTKANSIYAQRKADKHGIDIRYTAPENLPQIESDQVKAILEALVAINQELN